MKKSGDTSMSFKDKYIINQEFEDLFSFDSEKEELEHDAKAIMFRFLSSFNKMIDEPVKKKEIAEAINTSPSYITQLFKGDKLINLITLAKLEKAFDFTFEIQAKKNKEDYAGNIGNVARMIALIPKNIDSKFNNLKPNYNNKLIDISSREKIKNMAL